jgi:DNA repair protein Swi5/Sae3
VSGPPQSKLDLQKHAEAIVKRHIKLLHAYNEIRDVGQGLMGLIADARGVRLKEVMEEMGVGEKD